MRLRPSRPAPQSTVSASAISPMTNSCRIRRPREAPERLGAPSLSAVTRDSPVEPSAGASPQTIAVSTVIPTAKASTEESSEICESNGNGSRPWIQLTSAVSIHEAKTRPAAPPAIDSNSDSVRSCRRILLVPAPNAERMASSRRRAEARLSIRLPMLPQAISSTAPTAAKSARIVRRMSPTSWSRSGTTFTVHPVLKSGCSRTSSAMTPDSSACA